MELWSLALILAAMCVPSWIALALARDQQRSKELFDQTSSQSRPASDFSILALFAFVHTVVVGLFAAMSIGRPEIREVAELLLLSSLGLAAGLNTFFRFLTASVLVNQGVVFGWAGVVLFVIYRLNQP